MTSPQTVIQCSPYSVHWHVNSVCCVCVCSDMFVNLCVYTVVCFHILTWCMMCISACKLCVLVCVYVCGKALGRNPVLSCVWQPAILPDQDLSAMQPSPSHIPSVPPPLPLPSFHFCLSIPHPSFHAAALNKQQHLSARKIIGRSASCNTLVLPSVHPGRFSSVSSH